MGDMMKTAWQKNWTRFVKLLGEQLLRGTPDEEIATLFKSPSVMWTGVLTEKKIDDSTRLVTLLLPHAPIDLGNSGLLNLSEQSVSVARDSVIEWQSIPIGTDVTFTADFSAGQSPFLPLEVIHLSSGRTLVMIRLSNARPCSNAA
jgi:hypothetical protein